MQGSLDCTPSVFAETTAFYLQCENSPIKMSFAQRIYDKQTHTLPLTHLIVLDYLVLTVAFDSLRYRSIKTEILELNLGVQFDPHPQRD